METNTQQTGSLDVVETESTQTQEETSSLYTFKTHIVQLERTLPEGTVTTVHWRCQKGPASTYGAVGLNAPGEEFIPFEELTEDTVVDWLGEKIDLAGIEENLDKQIYDIENPKSTTGLPWGYPI
jgi:hypothetical protein